MSKHPESFDESHFTKNLRDNKKFWQRHGGMPSVQGKTALDLGCGRGAMSFQLAEAGAERVIGIDTDPDRIVFAKKKLESEYPHLRGKVEFRCLLLQEMEIELAFDLIVSKDVMEHVDDVPGLLKEFDQRLTSRGQVYLGFGPLYYSPYGDHHWTKAVIPWGHLIIPDRLLLARQKREDGSVPKSIREIGLNTFKFRDYVTAFKDCPMKVEHFKTNRGDHPVYKVSRFLSKMPVLRELFTFNIYCTLSCRRK
jgi:SAM-dependent methyltransferase